MPYLNARVVAIIYSTCAARAEETGKDIIGMPVPGTNEIRRFSVARLAQERDSIIRLLRQLPLSFTRGKRSPITDLLGTHEGLGWTGSQDIAMDLILLGMAIGVVRHHTIIPPERDEYERILFSFTLPPEQ